MFYVIMLNVCRTGYVYVWVEFLYITEYSNANEVSLCFDQGLLVPIYFAHELCRMGWTFAQDSANGQVLEVLDWHFRAVGQGIVR